MNFEGKKILFVSVSFFGYEKAIWERLKKLGAEVDFYDDRPSNSIISKGIVRVYRKLMQIKINNYYQEILKKTENKNYDYFLLIKGEAIPLFFLQKIKELHKNIQMIGYAYDSFAEHPNFKLLLPYLDKKFTFDRKDAQKFGLHFRPLFYINQYNRSVNSSQNPKYDLVFIGSVHTDRFLVGENIREFCDRKFLNTFFYYYAPSKIAFRLRKIFDENLKKFDIEKVSFKSLNHIDIINYYQNSQAVLDINKPFQDGLTIRTFEVLAMKKKLVTTNSDIKNYPFFNPQNIFVTDRKNIFIDPEFLKTEFAEIDEKIQYMMSLDSWLECLFFEPQDEYWNSSVK